MPKKLFKYRVYCSTENTYAFYWGESPPIACPNNNSHTIDTNTITIVDKIKQDQVEIVEEVPDSTPTEGRFRCTGLEMTANANAVTNKDFAWLYPINAMTIRFYTDTSHIGDYLNVFVIPTVPLGNTTNDTTSGNSTISVNASVIGAAQVGNMLCILDNNNTQYLGKVTSKDTAGSTITTEYATSAYFHKNASITRVIPVGINTLAVTAGDFVIKVSSTFLAKAKVGIVVDISDGTNTDSLGEILAIDKVNSTITVQNSADHSFNIGSFLYMSVHVVKNYKISQAHKFEIGESKIGGSYISPCFLVRASYTNNSNENKDFNWFVEYLY